MRSDDYLPAKIKVILGDQAIKTILTLAPDLTFIQVKRVIAYIYYRFNLKGGKKLYAKQKKATK